MDAFLFFVISAGVETCESKGACCLRRCTKPFSTQSETILCRFRLAARARRERGKCVGVCWRARKTRCGRWHGRRRGGGCRFSVMVRSWGLASVRQTYMLIMREMKGWMDGVYDCMEATGFLSYRHDGVNVFSLLTFLFAEEFSWSRET